MSKEKIKNNRYIVYKKTGEGSFSTVFLAFDKILSKACAIKMIEKPTKYSYRIMAANEMLSNVLLDHPNIVKCIEIFSDEKNINFVFEATVNTPNNLNDAMTNYNKNFSEEEIKNIFNDILNAISYCHSLRICHNDIKPNNVLIFTNESKTIYKLADWGLSTLIESNVFDEGNHIFLAPEVLKEENGACKSADIWSFGILIYFLFTRTTPFFSSSVEEYRENIKKYKYQDKYDNNVPSLYLNLIKKMIEYDPKKRISIETVKEEFRKI